MRSWPHSFELIRPFGSTNNHSIRLDELGGYDDPQKVPNPDFIARIEDAIERTWKDLVEFNDKDVISTSDYSKIKDILNRATLYASTATKIDIFWSEEYMPPDLKWINLDEGRPPGPIRLSPDAHWPLDEYMPWLGNCGSSYGDGAAMIAKSGQERTTKFKGPYAGTHEVSFKCPPKSDIEKHASDVENYKKLTQAAAQNARCAQELTYTIAFYKLNEQEQPGRVGKPVQVGVVNLGPTQTGVVDLGPGEEAPPRMPKGDGEAKKDNKTAMLALGAAAIAILALRK